MNSIALFHPAGKLSLPQNPFGKDVANLGLFQALIAHGEFQEVVIMNQLNLSDQDLVDQPLLESHISFLSSSLVDTDLPARSGTVLRGQPYLSELSWARKNARRESDYSLVGLIHTIAPPAIRELIGAAAIAPTHSWDALVCTSPVVQKSMIAMFDNFYDHLKLRFGSCRSPRPQLPLIPLAVDTQSLGHHGANVDARLQLRRRLNIAVDDVVVLWVGRLSFYEKAFPQSMFHAMQLASRRSKSRLHFLLAGWFPGGDDDLRLYQQAAEQLAPELNVVVLDGNDAGLVAQCWSAADIFLSLVDNIQETFGITPIEAMAAGLPVVVSDWDGYRYTVRDGRDGILIPTLACSGGAPGDLLAFLHSFGMESYQTYVGAVAQHTAVHVQQASAAIACLADNPDQRRFMGQSGQKRAQEMFSWPIIVHQYKELFIELSHRRSDASPLCAYSECKTHPFRGEPFADFRHFATHVLEPSLRLRIVEGVSTEDLDTRLNIQLNCFYPGLRATADESKQLLASLEAAGTSGMKVSEILVDKSVDRRPYLETSLVWLAKMGMIDWLPDDPGAMT